MKYKSVIAAALSAAFAASAAPNLEKALKTLPGATNYVFHLKRDAFADSLGLDFDSLDPCGYYLARRGKDVVIAGRTPKGCSYALADFLKRYAGYRNFGTKFGLIPPHTDNLVLPGDFTFREEPDVPSVNLAGGGGMGAFGRDGHLTCRATHAKRLPRRRPRPSASRPTRPGAPRRPSARRRATSSSPCATP